MPGALKRIGIGIAEDPDKVIASAVSVSGPFETVCYCCPGTAGTKNAGRNVQFCEDPHPEQALVDDLATGKIDAAVRGTLPSSSTLKALKKAMGVDHLEGGEQPLARLAIEVLDALPQPLDCFDQIVALGGQRDRTGNAHYGVRRFVRTQSG